MNTANGLASSLAQRMVQFIAFKRMQGYEYRGGAEVLSHFDAFLTHSGYVRRILQPDILERYAEAIAQQSHSTRAGKLSTVRQLSIYLHALAPESVLLPERLVPRAPRTIRFHPLSCAQVGELMASTAILKPRHELLAECMRFLIGMLYSTGLRISEVLPGLWGDFLFVASFARPAFAPRRCSGLRRGAQARDKVSQACSSTENPPTNPEAPEKTS